MGSTVLTVPCYTFVPQTAVKVTQILFLLFPTPPKFIQRVATQISPTTVQCTIRKRCAWTNTAHTVSGKAVGSVCEVLLPYQDGTAAITLTRFGSSPRCCVSVSQGLFQELCLIFWAEQTNHFRELTSECI